MAIKINNKDLYRRVINGRDVQRVILNGSQIRPASQGHIDYHVISNRGTGGGGGGGGGGSGVPGGWSAGGSTAVGENGITNGWDTGTGSQGTANLKYDGLPSLLNAYKVEIIYYFYWNQTETATPFDSFLEYNSDKSYGATILGSGIPLLLVIPYSLRVLSNPSAGNYVMTAVLDLENELVTTTLEGPNGSITRIEVGLNSTLIFNIRHSTDFWVYLNDGVRLSRTDFFVYNNLPAQPVGAGVYHNGILGVISLSSDGTNWMTIADKNLGATMVWNQGDALTNANCGSLFQRGNNHPFVYEDQTNTSNTQVDTTDYGPGNYYNSDVFITGNTDWSNPSNYNLWGGETGTNIAMQGPCASGFHVPSRNDESIIQAILDSLGFSGNRFEIFKMPLAGFINQNGLAVARGTDNYHYYWCGNSHSQGLIGLLTFSNYSEFTSASTGASIRPFANTPVVPDSTRTVLYQPS